MVTARPGQSKVQEAFLIVGFGGIGDHVRCFALARHIAAQHPGVAIDFLCRSPTDRLVPFVPDLRAAFVDDTPHRQFGLRAKLDLAARLREQRYRRVYVVSRTLKSALVPFLAGIPERVGWLGEGRVGLINRPRFGERGLHGETEKVCALASSKGLAGCGPLMPPRMAVAPDLLVRWQMDLPDGPPAASVLALAPGAYNDKRLWPVERFAAVARAFAAEGWEVWVLGGPQEREMARLIAAAVPVRDFTLTPLEDAVFQLASATLFLGNDSGMLHIAGALGVPSVGLFGPTALEVTGPRNPEVAGVRPPGQDIDLRQIGSACVIDALAEQYYRFRPALLA
ncbi:lipopolysaccharide heptosyltransferase II [Aquabacter cavernae]|uniref:lipopolysaccharide heptosyltransferase II n=1 Tax=Aquabacter cavernae TaxID=2496029 RepID=UPI000F8D02F6|nr:lipopolysaccharide heptosyltransferase II [Aquabacter cavernae]